MITFKDEEIKKLDCILELFLLEHNINNILNLGRERRDKK